MPKHYSREEKAQWRVLAEEGLSNRQIAAKVGVSRNTIARWIEPRNEPAHSPETIAEWQKMLDEEGMAYAHVAQIYGVCAKTVQKYLPGRAWTRKQISEHGSSVRRFNRANLSLVG